MGCRCSDINSCWHDISLLQNVVQQMGPVASLYASLQNKQSTIQQTEVQAYELNDGYRAAMQKRLQKNGAAGEQSIQDYSAYIIRTIERLEQELRSMEQEDDAYHSEDEE